MDLELVLAAEIAWSSDFRITRAEGACERVLGSPASVLIGQPLDAALGIPETRARELDRRGSAGISVEFLNQTRGDRVLRVSVSQKNELRRAGIVELNQLLAGAPPLQISKLSSSLSHEIRNPLSSVKMAVQTLAKNATLGDRDKRRLAIANREIRTMERMLWLFSEYGRETPPMLEAHPIRNIVTEAATLIDPELAERKIVLDIREKPAGLRARVDLARFRPVLAQTLLNVAMGLAAGSALPVAVSASAVSGAELVLEDSTFALLPEEREHLFEPFGSRLARGAGLSLAALQRVMMSFGGEVRAAGAGAPPTTLTLCFPE